MKTLEELEKSIATLEKANNKWPDRDRTTKIEKLKKQRDELK